MYLYCHHQKIEAVVVYNINNMKFGKLDVNHLLSIGLALTFLANSLSAFLTPDEFREIIEHSLIFNKILDFTPFFITVIGINDLIICVLLLTRLFSKKTAWWATIWISGVVLVFFSQLSLDGVFTALEHGAPLGIALYLVLCKQPRHPNLQPSINIQQNKILTNHKIL